MRSTRRASAMRNGKSSAKSGGMRIPKSSEERRELKRAQQWKPQGAVKRVRVLTEDSEGEQSDASASERAKAAEPESRRPLAREQRPHPLRGRCRHLVSYIEENELEEATKDRVSADVLIGSLEDWHQPSTLAVILLHMCAL